MAKQPAKVVHAFLTQVEEGVVCEKSRLGYLVGDSPVSARYLQIRVQISRADQTITTPLEERWRPLARIDPLSGSVRVYATASNSQLRINMINYLAERIGLAECAYGNAHCIYFGGVPHTSWFELCGPLNVLAYRASRDSRGRLRSKRREIEYAA